MSPLIRKLCTSVPYSGVENKWRHQAFFFLSVVMMQRLCLAGWDNRLELMTACQT